MAMATGRRARNVAVLAGALASLVGSLPAQELRDQIRDIAVMICIDSEVVADELEDADGELVPDGMRVVS